VSAVQQTGERVEALLTELGEAAGPVVAGRAEELVRALVELYGAGLARILELAGEHPDLVTRLTEDPLVAGLLVLHDLHPTDTDQRVRQALERVRPQLGRHAGDVELLEVGAEAVRLRLTGNCDGCPSSALTVRQAIETAILAAAPAAPAPGDGDRAPLLQIGRTPPHPYAGAACPAGAGGTGARPAPEGAAR
jgi:Fe-S cluster biogenesis protein NfuA